MAFPGAEKWVLTYYRVLGYIDIYTVTERTIGSTNFPDKDNSI